MSANEFNVDDLKNLPLRAIVAFATRCARRVEELAVPSEGDEATAARRSVAEALRLAEDFARGLPCPGLDEAIAAIESSTSAAQGDIVRENARAAVVRAARAAATAARAIAEEDEPAEPQLVGGGPPVKPMAPVAQLSADLAAIGAFTAARDAAAAQYSTDDLTRWAAQDYRQLLDLKLGHYPEAGEPVDPSPEGPLGPLR